MGSLWALSAIVGLALHAGAVDGGPTQGELDTAGQSSTTWPMTNKSYDGGRYAALYQINRDNAGIMRELPWLLQH